MIIKLKDGTIMESVAVTDDAITCEYDRLIDCYTFIDAVTEENVGTVEIDGVQRQNVHMRGDITITVTGGKFIATAFLEFPSELDQLREENARLKAYINDIGKTELVGDGSAESPFEYATGVQLIPNAYYLHEGVRYVFVDPVQRAAADWQTDSADMEAF